jgi:hypothetical protein
MNFLDQAIYDLGGLVLGGIIFVAVLWVWCKVYNYFH